MTPMSDVCTSRPPETFLKSNPVAGVPLPADQSPVSSTRTFFFAAQASSAAGSTDGAIMTSTNCFSMIAAAVFASSVRLNAMMPPNADVGSVRNAFS